MIFGITFSPPETPAVRLAPRLAPPSSSNCAAWRGPRDMVSTSGDGGTFPFAGLLDVAPKLKSEVFVAGSGEQEGWALGDRYYLFQFAVRAPAGNFGLLSVGRFQPRTFSEEERLACHLLSEISRQGGALDLEEDWRWLWAKLEGLNHEAVLTLLLSEGKRLYCYADAGGRSRLHITRLRKSEKEWVSAEENGESGESHGLLVSTFVPGEGRDSEPFEDGELIVAEGGRIRFSTHRPDDFR